MSRWFVRGLVALHMVSAEEVPDLLAGDSECASNGECALILGECENALQLTARARAEGPKAGAWSQCGGKKWKGASECADGSLAVGQAPKIYETVNPIIARGNFLYDSVTGKRFFAKGVAYNPRNEPFG
eukprot:Skav213150  [mRNA]  locus=scaffold107:619546:625030:- [translate_table: standard]